MSYSSILFAPLMVLLPAAGTVDARSDITGETVTIESEVVVPRDAAPAERYGRAQASEPSEAAVPADTPFRLVVESFRAQDANQVRIEQQMTIRISPRPAPVRPNMLMDLPGREVGPRFIERKMGKCVKASRIAGVQPDGGNRLLLFMRDQRIVSAELERACRSRDFYSGFYLSRSDDGQLCVDRDTLLSRSGANCRLTRIRQLVESGE
jgi:hypothetical protein